MRDKDAIGYAEQYGAWAINAVERGMPERAGTMTRNAIHYARILLGENNSGGNYSGDEILREKSGGYKRG